MKVCYLSWGETPRSYGVFGSQVLGQFIETKKQTPESEFYFISGVPIIHSGLVREKQKYGEELDKVKAKLGDIKFVWVPIFFTQNIVYGSRHFFKFLMFGAQNILKNKFLKINPDIVHCRSYYAAWIALTIKNKYGLNYKIIFDARGLFPEEYALKNKFSSEDKNYLFFKNIERKLLKDCDLTIAVSDTMKTYFEALHAKKVECVYLSANTEKLFTERENNKDEVVFGYVGALSEGTWHRTSELLKLYQKLRLTVKNPKIHIITTSNHNEIKEAFKEIPESEIYLSSTRTVEELKDKMKKFNFGIMSYFNAKDKFELTLSDMVLAVKSAEYLAAGLPMIVNEKCGGISYIINKFDLGITYNPDTYEQIDENIIRKFVNDGKDLERSKLASELFDYKNNANRYTNYYNSLLQ
ncbi:glycosyltransferase [Chryseobacterium sp. 'Rf worker isolate 10']|jgi:glycosyltransferase involved in cell wall biosynthesis|uniref:glycosyltransferase n=1 Tax=Chryseobacterium sp. 'Rf worker isolate 10' TaxID=2887348 RepID=UPI003D6EF716